MALTADQIRANLTAFAARWDIGEWGERKEAQTFLNELFQCFGKDRREWAEFEHFEAGGFFDLVWPRVCLIEMKSSKEADHLSRHRVQAMTYPGEGRQTRRGHPSPGVCGPLRVPALRDLATGEVSTGTADLV